MRTEEQSIMVNREDLVREEQFWDSVGDRWMRDLRDGQLKVGAPQEFLSGSTVAFDYLMEVLGNVDGKHALDYGCGSGWLSTYLAQRGARVDGFDISASLVELGMKRATVNGVADRVSLKKMIAEKLEYPDGTFDCVVGISILHHVSLQEGGEELYRVMKDGGRALFIEPLGESRIQNAIRNYVLRVHHGHIREVDAEHPLTYANIRAFGARFRATEFRELQLTEMIARLVGDRVTNTLGLRKLDTCLLDRFPALRRFCRLVVITYTK